MSKTVRKKQSALPSLFETFAIENWIFRLSCNLCLFFDRTLVFTLKMIFHALKLVMISVFISSLTFIIVTAIEVTHPV